jgi:hypothetical protein
MMVIILVIILGPKGLFLVKKSKNSCLYSKDAQLHHKFKKSKICEKFHHFGPLWAIFWYQNGPK